MPSPQPTTQIASAAGLLGPTAVLAPLANSKDTEIIAAKSSVCRDGKRFGRGPTPRCCSWFITGNPAKGQLRA